MKDIVEKIISTDFDGLKNLKFNFNEKTGLIVNYEGYEYEFVINLIENENNIIVFSPNLLNQKQKNEKMGKPVFSRHAWCENLKYNTIFYNDPTRYDFQELNGGWGIGTEKVWHLENISKIIKQLSKLITNYNKYTLPDYSNLFFYGNSMGGYMSIIMSILIENSTSIVDKPQFNLFKDKNWKNLKRFCFKNRSNEIIKRYGHKLDVLELMNQQKVIPNSYIVVDSTDNYYWDNQYTNFFNNLNKAPFNYNKSDSKIVFRVDGRYQGHKSLSKEDVLNLIDEVVFIQNRKNSFNPVKLQMINELKETIDTFYTKFSNDEITFERFKSLKNQYSGKWANCRVDMKNFGKKDNTMEILENDEEVIVDFPKWNKNDTGEGCNIISNQNSINLKIRCVNDGKLQVKLRGPSFNWDNKKIPIYISYEKLKINDELIFQKPIEVWHNAPYTFSEEVKDGDILNLEIEFNTLYDYYPYLQKIIQNMDDEENIIDSYETFKEYIRYLNLVNKSL